MAIAEEVQASSAAVGTKEPISEAGNLAGHSGEVGGVEPEDAEEVVGRGSGEAQARSPKGDTLAKGEGVLPREAVKVKHLSALDQLIGDIASFSLDPSGFVKYAYPWGQGELLKESGARKWQEQVLQHIGAHLQNPKTRCQPCRIAIASGHGVGKTALEAWLVDWALSTCDDARVVLTANTEPQLRTKTWPEVSKWFRFSINSHWWKFEETSIHSKVPDHERTWRADRITWSENNTEAFAGLHNQGKRILIIFDEASGIHEKIWEVTEGALTDENTEIIWIVLSNPTLPYGAFRECFGKQMHRWKTMQIDSRTVEGTNRQEAQKLIEDYGEDHDRVRVRVRGEFPLKGSDRLISGDLVWAARSYKAKDYENLPKIFGLDVARFGEDRTTLYQRQGRHAECLGKWRGKDTAQVAALVAEAINYQNPAVVVIDSDGIGAPVYDQLKFMGYGRLLVDFHGAKPANKPEMYHNRRTEVWALMMESLKAGMEIPNDPELASDLTGPQYDFNAKQQMVLEKKDDMKERGLSSPDCGDALAYTFAVQLAAPPKPLPKPHFIQLGRESALEWMRG